jgi:dolichol-phosphate mannosyltransferase
MTNLKLAIVTPVYNEEQVIAHFHSRTKAVLDQMDDVEGKIIYVVDRCPDETLDILRKIIAVDPLAEALALSSRFGHQMSLLAGIEHALDADVIVMMDCDLQHPPELIPELLARFREGYEIVYTIRQDTKAISPFRKAAGSFFYKILRKLTQVPINSNAADFRLISQRVAIILTNNFPERNMFLRGLFSWIGYRQTSVNFVAEKRFAGKSKYTLSKMIRLATTGMLSFSTKPLQIGIFIGVAFAFIAMIMIIWVVIDFFLKHNIPSGWTTLVVCLLLFSGVQLIVLGILGVYIGSIFEEVKRRPRYLVEERIVHHG